METIVVAIFCGFVSLININRPLIGCSDKQMQKLKLDGALFKIRNWIPAYNILTFFLEIPFK